jgi:hypothetical protein
VTTGRDQPGPIQGRWFAIPDGSDEDIRAAFVRRGRCVRRQWKQREDYLAEALLASDRGKERSGVLVVPSTGSCGRFGGRKVCSRKRPSMG